MDITPASLVIDSTATPSQEKLSRIRNRDSVLRKPFLWKVGCTEVSVRNTTSENMITTTDFSVEDTHSEIRIAKLHENSESQTSFSGKPISTTLIFLWFNAFSEVNHATLLNGLSAEATFDENREKAHLLYEYIYGRYTRKIVEDAFFSKTRIPIIKNFWSWVSVGDTISRDTAVLPSYIGVCCAD